MADDPALRQTPEQQELDAKRARLEQLETELAQRELDLATLQAELRAFESRYVRTVGVLYRELDDLEAKNAEARASRRPDDPRLHDEAAAARARATETASAASVALGRKLAPNATPPDDLKKVFREIARKVHPDLTTDDKERARRHRVMSEANQAYEEGDEAKLRAIVDEWYSSPEAVEGEGIGAELIRAIRKIRQIEQRLVAISAAIEQLTRSKLYELKKRADAAQGQGRDLLAEMAAQLHAEIQRAESQAQSEGVV